MKHFWHSPWKITLSALGLVTTLALIAIIAVSAILQPKVIYPNHAETVPLPTALVDRVSLTFDEKTPNFERFTIAAPDGYQLDSAYVPAANPSQKYVILVHGITRNIEASMKLVPLFRDAGYNVILFSLRNHGENAPDITTYGTIEKADLAAVVDYTYARFGDDITLGLHGISMGASIALQYAGMEDANVDFIISDCAYSSAMAELNVQLAAQYPSLSWFPFVETTSLLIQATQGADANIRLASPIAAVPNISVPVFFIHGLADDFIPATMAVELYQAKTTGVRELWLVPDAGHDDALETNVAAYEAALNHFLSEIGA